MLNQVTGLKTDYYLFKDDGDKTRYGKMRVVLKSSEGMK